MVLAGTAGCTRGHGVLGRTTSWAPPSTAEPPLLPAGGGGATGSPKTGGAQQRNHLGEGGRRGPWVMHSDDDGRESRCQARGVGDEVAVSGGSDDREGRSARAQRDGDRSMPPARRSRATFARRRAAGADGGAKLAGVGRVGQIRPWVYGVTSAPVPPSARNHALCPLEISMRTRRASCFAWAGGSGARPRTRDRSECSGRVPHGRGVPSARSLVRPLTRPDAFGSALDRPCALRSADVGLCTTRTTSTGP
jgi:hypothetical protein